MPIWWLALSAHLTPRERWAGPPELELELRLAVAGKRPQMPALAQQSEVIWAVRGQVPVRAKGRSPVLVPEREGVLHEFPQQQVRMEWQHWLLSLVC